MKRISLLALLLSLPVAGFAQWSPEVPLTEPTLVPAALGQGYPAAASDGESWFAVWQHTTDWATRRVVGLVIRADGTTATPLPTLLFDGDGTEPAVVWNGSRYLVVWSSGYFSILGQWVTRDGEPDGPVFQLIGEYVGTPDVASNGREVLVIGEYAGGVLLRQDGSLAAIETLGFYVIGVISDGDSFLVYGRMPGFEDILAYALVSSEGSVLSRHTRPDLHPTDGTWTGTEYVIAGISGAGPASNATLLRISATGQPLGDPIRLSDDRVHSGVRVEASGDGGVLAGWTVFNNWLDGQTRIAHVSDSGEVTVLPLEVPESAAPYFARSHGSLLILWDQELAIRHQRLSSSGDPLDEPRITSLSARDQTRPAVAATDLGFIAAWEERGELVQRGPGASRIAVGPLRSRPSASRILVPSSDSGQIEPVVASSGDTVLVGWLQADSAGQEHVMVQRYSPRGLPLEHEPSDLGEMWQYYPSVSRLAAFWTGKVYLAAWSSQRGLRYARVTREGVVLDPEPMHVPQPERWSGSTDPFELAQLEPQLAAAGDRLLLVWQSSFIRSPCGVHPCPPPVPSPRIEAVRLDADGMILDPVPITLSSDTYGEIVPRVASNGDSFLVVWQTWEGLRGVAVSREGAVEPRDQIAIEGAAEGLVGLGPDFFLLTRRENGRLDGYFISAEGAIGAPLAISSGEVWSGPPREPSSSTAMTVHDNGVLAILFTRMEEELGLVRRIVYRTLGTPIAPRGRLVVRR